METFQFEKTSFQIEPFDSEKLSVHISNKDKTIDTGLFLWLERDATYSVYVPEAQKYASGQRTVVVAGVVAGRWLLRFEQPRHSG
jgi:hypothetical protein